VGLGGWEQISRAAEGSEAAAAWAVGRLAACAWRRGEVGMGIGESWVTG
jgi:hypothetical protein